MPESEFCSRYNNRLQRCSASSGRQFARSAQRHRSGGARSARQGVASRSDSGSLRVKMSTTLKVVNCPSQASAPLRVRALAEPLG